MVAEDSSEVMERELETAGEAEKLNPNQTEDEAARWWKIYISATSGENPGVGKVRTQAEVGKKSAEDEAEVGSRAERRWPEEAEMEEPRRETGKYETEAKQNEAKVKLTGDKTSSERQQSSGVDQTRSDGEREREREHPRHGEKRRRLDGRGQDDEEDWIMGGHEKNEGEKAEKQETTT